MKFILIDSHLETEADTEIGGLGPLIEKYSFYKQGHLESNVGHEKDPNIGPIRLWIG